MTKNQSEQIKAMLPVLRRFAYSLTGSMADADDLLQNTVEKLLTKPVPDDVELLAWSYRICRNLWIDEYRANKVRQAAVHNPELQQAEVDATAQITSDITLKQVESAMATLPDDQREVLSLVAVQGMSYQDTANVLSVPSGTVMSRLARARSKLAQILFLEKGTKGPNGNEVTA